MKPPFANRVIVIGADHHNTLAAVRCLAEQGCDVLVVIHEHRKHDWYSIAHCKFVHAIEYVLENEQALVDLLLANTLPEKQILFPCSDFAAFVMDSYGQALAPHFYLPGFAGQFGKVAQMMDKFCQYKFALDNGLPTARSHKIMLTSPVLSLPEDILYPCIVKPDLSAFGSKQDIRVLDTPDALKDYLLSLREKGYPSVLVQQFLRKQYEVCASGCITERAPYFYGGVLRKIRELPPPGPGATAYAYFVRDSAIDAFLQKLVEIMHRQGYRGVFDAEMFVCDDGIYLNEINYRHSGIGPALIRGNIPAPFIFAVDSLGLPYGSWNETPEELYYWDEVGDIGNIKAKVVSPLGYFRSFFRAKAFAVLSLRDLPGSWAFYRPVFTGKFNSIMRKLRGSRGSDK